MWEMIGGSSCSQVRALSVLPYALMRLWCTLWFEALRRLIKVGSRPARPNLPLLLPLKRRLGGTSIASLQKPCQKLQLRERGDGIYQGKFGHIPIFLFDFILPD